MKGSKNKKRKHVFSLTALTITQCVDTLQNEEELKLISTAIQKKRVKLKIENAKEKEPDIALMNGYYLYNGRGKQCGMCFIHKNGDITRFARKFASYEIKVEFKRKARKTFECVTIILTCYASKSNVKDTILRYIPPECLIKDKKLQNKILDWVI